MRALKLFRRTDDRPSLKDRVAALKAKAAKVMRRKPAVAPDPILAAIADHRIKWDAAEAIDEGSPRYAAAQDAFIAAFDRLCATRPTTIAGYHALADHLVWRLRQEGYAVGSGQTIVETAADLLIAGAGVLDTTERGPDRSCASDPADEYSGLLGPILVTAGFDMTALPWTVLEALHDAAETIGDVSNAMLCQPRFENERRGVAVSHNAAGGFLDWLTDVSDVLMNAARQEAKRRRPNDEDARERRLAILAHYTVVNGDPAEMRAFARDLQAEARRLTRG